MNLWYISNSLLPSERANGVNIVKMCEGFAANGHQVTLVLPSHQSVTNEESIVTFYSVKTNFTILPINLKNKAGWLYLFALKAFQLLNKNKNEIDVVVSRFPLALMLCTQLKKPLVIDIHGKIWEAGFINSFCINKLCKTPFLKKITFNTERLKQLFQSKHENKHLKSIALEAHANGAEIPLFSSSFVLKGNHSVNIGYIGSLHSGRGIEIIVQLAHRLPDFGFHLAGGPELQKLEIGKSAPKNLYLYGHLPFQQTASFRAACSLLLAPYQSSVKVPSGEQTADYMSPIKLFEYMSSRRPMIVSDLPSIRAVIKENVAIFCKQDDINDWQQAIGNFLSQPQETIKMVDNAYAEFLNNFTWEKRAENVLKNIEFYS